MIHEDKSTLPLGYTGRVEVSKQFSIKPLIPARPLGKPVVLYGDSATRKCKIKARIGAVSKNRERDDGEGLCPSLHVDLWQLILVLLSMWEERPFGIDSINPGFNEVWRRYSESPHRPSAMQRESLARLWDELDALRMLVEIPGEPDRLVDVVHYETVRQRLNTGTTTDHAVSGFSFDLRFLEVVRYANERQHVRLDVIAPITSPFVRAAYLWLPALAFRAPMRHAALSDRDVPVSPELRQELVGIPSKAFMESLGAAPLPRGARKQRLLQHGERSILWQLHGLPLLTQGTMLGVTSWDAEDDFYVGAYIYTSADWVPSTVVRKRPTVKRDTMLYTGFVTEGGGEPAAYIHWINHAPLPNVDDYQVERLRALGVENLDNSEPFLRMAVALLGPDLFRTVVGYLSETTIKSSATGLFRTMVKKEVARVARARTDAYHLVINKQARLPLDGPGDS